MLKKILFLSIAVFSGCCSPNHHYDLQTDPEPLLPFHVPENIRVALVLGSGGVRGMAHVGVIEELVAAGIPIDLIVGCSAGSIVGALYADNPCVEDLKVAVWKLKTESMLDIDLLHCKYGLSQGCTMRKVLDEHIEANCFEELKIPLVVVASDLYSGELVPMATGRVEEAVQGSCSIPFFFVPCHHMGRILVDGGVVNPVPVKIARDLGAKIIIAVDLCELLPKTCPKNLFEIFLRSAEIEFMWQNEVCTRSADVIIRPKTCGIGTFNEKMKHQLYLAGKHAAQIHIPQVLELMKNLSKEDQEASKTTRLVSLEAYTPQIYHEE